MGNENIAALTTIINALKELDQESQKRILQSVCTFLGISTFSSELQPQPVYSATLSDKSSQLSEVSFSTDRNASPKAFLRDKMPTTDVERVACLAYYLTHYRDTPHFKTLELSTLNTEAAQPKFSNATYAVDNATKAGLLVPAVKGTKQLSAAGELFVQALPDREAARTALKNFSNKKRVKKTSKTSN